MIDVTSHDGNNLWEVDVVVIGFHKHHLTLSFQCKSVLTIRWEWSMEDSQKFYSISIVLKLICTCIFSLGKWSLSSVEVFFVQVLLLVLFPHAAWSWKYKPKRIVVFKYFNKHLSKSCCGRGLPGLQLCWDKWRIWEVKEEVTSLASFHLWLCYHLSLHVLCWVRNFGVFTEPSAVLYKCWIMYCTAAHAQ